MKKTILIALVGFMLTGCDVLNQIGGAISLSQCEYTYDSISDIQIAGLNLGNSSNISLSNLATISTILTGGNLQTIPFNMTLNVDVKNPNQVVAFLNALDYAIDINDMEFAAGKMDVPIRIESGQTQVLPISIGVDLKNLMNRYSTEKVANEMSAFLGIRSDQTKVTLRLWPKVMVGNTPIKVPAAIPVVFTFGGK